MEKGFYIVNCPPYKDTFSNVSETEFDLQYKNFDGFVEHWKFDEEKNRWKVERVERDLQYICSDCGTKFDSPDILSESKETRKGYESDECCPKCGSVNIECGLE